jgi:Tol biopolymer transport system component
MTIMPGNYFPILLLFACQNIFAQNAKQPITVADMDSIRDVTDPQISPDTKWVAYSVSSTNFKKDQSLTDIWMTSWDGNTTIQLTHTDDESESSPRWSPDNMYLAFLSSRKLEDGDDQIWLLNRAGGEAKKITSFPGGVEYFTWSPDGKKIALIANLTDTNKFIEGTQTPAPVVIDRFYFKEDVTGYMTTTRHHLYVLDIATGDTERIVDGNFNEDLPTWSPDGKSIAFVSKRAQRGF